MNHDTQFSVFKNRLSTSSVPSVGAEREAQSLFSRFYAHVDSLTSITPLENDRDTTNITAEERERERERETRGDKELLAVLPSASTPPMPAIAPITWTTTQ